jgi:alpha-beta hydrolase superfamily lysophospholipase
MDHAEGTFPGDGGTPLYYQCWLPQTTTRAVLAVVHGFFEHSGRYENLANWLVPRGYAVFALDQRGHGRSPGKRGQLDSLDQVHGDIRGFLALAHAEVPDVPLFLFGHSQGGLLVLNYVLHDPSGVRGVVTSSPCLRQRLIPQALIPVIKVLSRVAPWLSVQYRLDPAALTHDPAVVEAYESDPLVHGRGRPRTAAMLFAAADWTMAHAHDLRVPCLILHGADDKLCAPEAAAEFCGRVPLTDKTRIEYPGFYHEVLNEIGKERVLADMEAWLDRHL